MKERDLGEIIETPEMPGISSESTALSLSEAEC